MAEQPLGEVFGFPITNHTEEATHTRTMRLCPFNNKVPNCTKDKANNPLGVCSVYEGDSLTVTCPVRFREKWRIATDAAAFFFPPESTWTSLVEVKLKDYDGKSAGNIDVVLVSYDNQGKVLDFGSLEVQAVYISGNVRAPFSYFMEDPQNRGDMSWQGKAKYALADFLSSSRKRLAPQLIFKGGILHLWKKKQAVAIDRAFFNTLPPLTAVSADEAELAWFVYDLVHDNARDVYELQLLQTVYTAFEPTMETITTAKPGLVGNFIDVLQAKLDEKLDGTEPEAPALDDVIIE